MTRLLLLPSASVLASSGSFSGHETFVFRYGWLKKGLDGWRARADIFTADEAIAALGVGKNMVRSIRHWCLATRLFDDEDGRRGGICPSAFGQLLLEEGDPFLEQDASLWLLHWQLATNAARSTTWFWAFNVSRDAEWTRESLHSGLTRWLASRGKSMPSESVLKSDVSCFMRTYVSGRRGPASTPEETLDCPLAALGLVVEVEGDKRFRFNTRPKPSLPPAVFAFALLDFWAARHAEAETLSLREITHGEGSPGRVFRLDDDAVLGYLDALPELTGGRLTFMDTALVRQVSRRAPVSGEELLRAFYQVH